MQKLETLAFHKIDLTDGAKAETGGLRAVDGSTCLPERIGRFCNPKSSTGRIDVFTRIITDFGVEFDKALAGMGHPYSGQPRTFLFPVKGIAFISNSFRRQSRPFRYRN